EFLNALSQANSETYQDFEFES
ncbi:hypothetical protein CCACVL1_22870, partial [Corchorus capsularis]